MRVTARGWARDMGRKTLISSSLTTEHLEAAEIERYERNRVYFTVDRDVLVGPRGRRRTFLTAKVAAHAELNLNGSYLIELELSRDEIARLFYLTNGDRSLPEMMEFFAGLRKD